ncbi:MAG: peptidyl-prolyl cis-trans isomerase [Blastocatellia bacterium]|nr:peptidyl-prolyl cis-trans isomerase [Blastocatellia bacterium]
MRKLTLVVLACLTFVAACGEPKSSFVEKPEEEKKVTKKEVKDCDPAKTKPVKPAEDPGTVEIQHILISFVGNKGNVKLATPRTKEEAEKLAKELLERTRNCEDFNKLVTKYSDDPNKMNDSKYNMFPGFYEIPGKARKGFNKDFVACAIGMSPGNIDLVESQYGYHVMLRKK